MEEVMLQVDLGGTTIPRMQFRQITEVARTPSAVEELTRLVASSRAMMEDESAEAYNLLKQNIEAAAQEL
eukprot:12901452-Prorocentrum_lima.AAC.1